MDLTSALENVAKGNKVFNSIRLRRARVRAKEKEKEYNGRLRPSFLSFTGCPNTFFRNVNSKEEVTYGDPEKNFYLAEASKRKHEEFQDELKLLTLRDGLELHHPLKLEQIHEKARFKLPKGKDLVECIELPFYYEPYNMMGFLDAVVVINGKVIIGDFKNKQVPNKSDWKNQVKTMFPLEKDVAQLSAYKYVTKQLNYMSPDLIGIWYYNTCLTGDLDAEWEFYLNIPDEITKYMLDSWNDERLLYLAGKESSCQYKYCQEHGDEKLFIRDFLVKL